PAPRHDSPLTSTLSLHDALPIYLGVHLLLEGPGRAQRDLDLLGGAVADGEGVLLLDELHDGVVELVATHPDGLAGHDAAEGDHRDRKSTRLNSSHVKISYAVFCL